MGKATPQQLKLRSDKYAKNIEKRGHVETKSKKNENSSPVGPVILGIFLFAVLGSAIVSIVQTIAHGSIF